MRLNGILSRYYALWKLQNTKNNKSGAERNNYLKK